MEHKDALDRAVSLNIAHPLATTEEDSATGEGSKATMAAAAAAAEVPEDPTPPSISSRSSGRTNWDELVEKLFTRNESGHLVLKKEVLNIDDGT